MEDLLVERKQAIPDGITPREFALYYLLFMTMGAGANWVFPTALAQEVPYLQDHLPEGLCIATYMNAFTSAGVLSMLGYVALHYHWGPFPYTVTVPCLLTLSSIGCFVSAGVYDIAVDGISVPLFLCCVLGGSVGALSSVIMNPFMTSFHNSYISAARSGGSGLILLTALLALAQSPGASRPRFSVAAYLCAFGTLLLLPLCAYRYIVLHRVGLRSASKTEGEESAQVAGQLEMAANPVHSADTPHATSPSSNPLLDVHIAHPSSPLSPSPTSTSTPAPVHRQYAAMVWLQHTLVSPARHADMPWLRDVLPYGLAVGWVNFNTWGVVCALVPFAMAQASLDGDGSLNLSIAYQLAAVLLVCGDLSTTFTKLPLLPCVLVFTGLCATIYAAALGAPGFQFAPSAALLMVVYAVERFLEAHVVTSVYRAVATNTPAHCRQAATRVVGVCDQISTTLGAALATLAVSLLFRCGGEDDDS